jgi:hypothetical protein
MLYSSVVVVVVWIPGRETETETGGGEYNQHNDSSSGDSRQSLQQQALLLHTQRTAKTGC